VLNTRNRIVIIGATSAIAEHCARIWVGDAEVDITLVARDKIKVDRVAADLHVRSPKSVIRVIEADFIEPAAIRSCVDQIVAMGTVHTVLIAHGTLPEQVLCQENLALCSDALIVNGISPVLFAEAFAGHMQIANQGTLAIIGSVAGDRGRKSNYAYGAAKGLVTRYVQGLQHRFAKSNVKVVLIKPGPTDTPMTSKLKQKVGNFARVEDVAARIVKGVYAAHPVVYAPPKWSLIMMVIRHLPRFVFNRMDI
jgi:short-subunit dehydrogenase